MEEFLKDWWIEIIVFFLIGLAFFLYLLIQLGKAREGLRERERKHGISEDV